MKHSDWKSSTAKKLQSLVDEALKEHPKDYRAAVEHVWLRLDGDMARVAFAKFKDTVLGQLLRDRAGDGRSHIASPANSKPESGRTFRDTQSARAASPASDGAGQRTSGTRSIIARPAREPSTAQRKAAGAVGKEIAQSIFTQSIGGELTFGTSTRQDWINFKRKGMVIEHVADRMITEIEWPNDTTPLIECAPEAQVRAIRDSGYKMLDALGVTNVNR